MNNLEENICCFCEKKLRKTKRVDFKGRNFHFKCKDLDNEIKYQNELNIFLEYFKSHNILVRL